MYFGVFTPQYSALTTEQTTTSPLGTILAFNETMKIKTLSLLFAVSTLSYASPPCGGTVSCADDLSSVASSQGTSSSDRGITLRTNAFENQGLRSEVLELALSAYETAWENGDTTKRIITVIDFSMPSSEKRMWVIDLTDNTLLFRELVAHGSGSGANRASSFSNVEDSHQSSIGLLKTAETYTGKHGYSLKLDGLEPGWNSNARDRYIVVHAANYVSEEFVARNGRLGRSWGCPALRNEISKEVIDTIKGGSLMFAYYPDQRWLNNSEYLND